MGAECTAAAQSQGASRRGPAGFRRRAAASLDRLVRPDAPERGAREASPRPRRPRSRTSRRGRPRAARPPPARPSPAPPPPRSARRGAAPAPSPRTSAVRTPERSAWCTQPPAPSASRTRRQWPYSAVISSGSPRRTNSQSTRWSRLGPRRALALSARIETKRGSGRLVTGPRAGSAAAGAGGARAARERRSEAPSAARGAHAGATVIGCPALVPDAGKCLDFSGPPVQLCRRP